MDYIKQLLERDKMELERYLEGLERNRAMIEEDLKENGIAIDHANAKLEQVNKALESKVEPVKVVIQSDRPLTKKMLEEVFEIARRKRGGGC